MSVCLLKWRNWLGFLQFLLIFAEMFPHFTRINLWYIKLTGCNLERHKCLYRGPSQNFIGKESYWYYIAMLKLLLKRKFLISGGFLFTSSFISAPSDRNCPIFAHSPKQIFPAEKGMSLILLSHPLKVINRMLQVLFVSRLHLHLSPA